ncbi:RNA methyltransferase [Aggregicoccus sp. 17bor-14]|uniref:RNA methyltransferase n=1 Tax=Myxococcaceae TaxID=31 RepID=UPI00129C37C8|nr:MULTISPECIES: RNA methyltransferase [Myxococcaceae]MBF5044495.1 RNA methyltransferase [Simulacricoccus sp. 17bor-14]MRI90240.1 RNA methyltransferase [Aggregicoccus sp. 17bor-14]
MSLAANIRVVLHQTQSPDNLGSVARGMANFELSRLLLSQPGTFDIEDALKLGVKGEGVLDALQVVDSIPAALEGCVWACGTTSRIPLEGRTVLTPEEAVAKLVQQAQRGPVALVLGGEKRGLSNEELDFCPDILAIRTGSTQPSMNLAQAATVLFYLLSRELARVEGEAPIVQEVPPGARMGTVHALGNLMLQTLLTAGFLNPQEPEYVLRELELSLLRAQLTQREAELWLNAWKHVARAMKRRPESK